MEKTVAEQRDGLLSHADRLDPSDKLMLAIAAKVASLTILAGRYDHNLKAEKEEKNQSNENPHENENVEELTKETQADVDDQLTRMTSMMKTTAMQATDWLALVCKDLDIDLKILPEHPKSQDNMKNSIKQTAQHDLAYELVFVSLNLASQSAKTSGDTQVLDYQALSRSLSVRTLDLLGIDEEELIKVEKEVAQFLFFQLAKDNEEKNGATPTETWDEAATAGREAASKKNKAWKWVATGTGVVLGGVAIGLTGGLAAPAIAPLLAGTMGIAAFGGASGAVLIGTLLGLGGGGLAGYRTHKRMKGLDDLTFEPLRDPDLPPIPSLNCDILCSGYLLDLNDSVEPWRKSIDVNQRDAFAIKADPLTFLTAGKALDNYVRNKIIKLGGVELLKKTALAAVYAGVALPLSVFSGASMLLDSDFSRCRDKAQKAGILLSEILEKQVQGKRPVTLMGYGPGATVLMHCLIALHKKEQGHLVYSAILISLPDSPSPIKWAAMRSVVSHRLVNCFSSNDWVLAINARLYTLSSRVAGLQRVNCRGVDDIDCSDIVGGHLELRGKLKTILDRVESGEVPSPEAVKAKAEEIEKDQMVP